MQSDAVEPFITTRCIQLERALIGIGGFVLLFLLPHQVSSDGLVRYDTLRVLMDKGTISPEKYSFLQTVLSVPLYLAGEFSSGKAADRCRVLQRARVPRSPRRVLVYPA